MSIETPDELAGLKAAGQVVRAALKAMRRAVRPDVSTRELDQIAGRVFAQAGARSGPQLDYGFPGVCCISINNETVHGIPGPRRLRDGDLVKLDVTAELDGFYADACITVAAGRARPSDRELIATAQHALSAGLHAALAGAPLNAIGAAIAQTVTARGYSICRELMGHGIGRRIHEPPNVPNYFVDGLTQPLSEGLVLTIEPIVSAGNGHVRAMRDGWTIATADGARTAHVEHTIVIGRGRPLLLTA